MQVIDTSAWIEWFSDSALGRRLKRTFPDRTTCVVPTVVQLELAKWLLREAGEEAADRTIAYTQKCVVVPLDTAIALSAADLHQAHKLATADAIVYATALACGANVITCDADFRHLPHVTYHAKSR